MLYKYKSSDPLSCEKPKGFLIDLDLAKYIGPTPTPATSTSGSFRRRTGTMFFMAIEILKGTHLRHSWRHDLESFFYVLIWLCVTAPTDSYPEAKTMMEQKWGCGNAAREKLAQVTQEEDWDDMVGLFAPSMSGGNAENVLCGWRQVLFPAKLGGFGVVTGEEGRDRGEVYDKMIQILEQELLRLST